MTAQESRAGAPGAPAGRVVAVFVKPARSQPVVGVDRLVCAAGLGIEGDANADPSSDRQVLFVASEVEAELDLAPGALWENVTTEGIDVDSLAVGATVEVGTATVRITGPCNPCSLICRVTGVPARRLRGCRGVLGVVTAGGVVKTGDAVEVRRP